MEDVSQVLAPISLLYQLFKYYFGLKDQNCRQVSRCGYSTDSYKDIHNYVFYFVLFCFPNNSKNSICFCRFGLESLNLVAEQKSVQHLHCIWNTPTGFLPICITFWFSVVVFSCCFIIHTQCHQWPSFTTALVVFSDLLFGLVFLTSQC